MRFSFKNSIYKKLVSYFDKHMEWLLEKSVNSRYYYWPTQTRLTAREHATIAEYDYLSKTSTRVGVTDEPICGKEVIVSLTTYGERLHSVYLTIESLLQQTVKPNKIILWLAYDLEGRVPVSLQRLVDRGLTIKFTKDIRSYKKLVPALKEYPEAIIITFDDDYIYQQDMVERLLDGYKLNSNVVSCGMGSLIQIDDNNLPGPFYSWWNKPFNKLEPNKRIMAIGFNGVLYPPHCLHEDVINEELFTSMCPIGDDVWFKTMALRAGTSCQEISIANPFHYNVELTSVQDIGLKHQNDAGGQNDIQIHTVWTKYNLYELISS